MPDATAGRAAKAAQRIDGFADTAAEPERADYQRDLVVSLVRVSDISTEPGATDALARARKIVEDLAAGGRLAPADGWMLEDLRRRLDEHRAAT